MTTKHNSSELEKLFQTKSTLGLIASMALPTIASQLIGVIYNYADSIYVGWLNHPEEVAAIALALPLMLAMTALANFWGIGGGSAISRALGSGNRAKAEHACAISFYGSIISASALSFAFWLTGDNFIRILGASNTVLPYAKAYLFWFFTIGGLPTVLSMVLAHLIRAEGYARPASRGLMLGGLLNVLLDPIFIFQFGFNMGVPGAAIATAISNLVSVIYFALFIWSIRQKTTLSFKFHSGWLSAALTKEIMLVGTPSALIMLLSAISNNVLNALIAPHGDRVLAAVGIAKKIDMLPNHIGMGITQGALPLLAYAFASANYTKLKEVLFTTLKLTFSSLLLLIILLEIFAPYISRLFIRDAETVQYASSFIRIVCLSVPLFASSSTINTFYQAINRPKTAFALSLLRKGILDIPLMVALEATLFITNIIWAQPIMDFITIIISLIVIRHTIQTTDSIRE